MVIQRYPKDKLTVGCCSKTKENGRKDKPDERLASSSSLDSKRAANEVIQFQICVRDNAVLFTLFYMLP